MKHPLPIAIVLVIAMGPISSARSVRDSGAVGDGKSDDTAAIQKAVRQPGESAEFPKGAYRITSTITIDLDQVNRMSLTADGTATIIMAGPGPALQNHVAQKDALKRPLISKGSFS